jgi:hypothetical protein
MLETPDAEPTWVAETDAVAADDAGPLDGPIPMATATGRTKAAYRHGASTKPIAANPPAVIANPAATTWRPPNRTARRGTSGATSTSPTVAGSVARPASYGLNPRVSASWK